MLIFGFGLENNYFTGQSIENELRFCKKFIFIPPLGISQCFYFYEVVRSSVSVPP